MNLPEFLRETQASVRSQMRDGALYEELVFSGIVMDHMSDIGMTFEPVECHFEGKVGNANLRLSGYSLSDESDQLDLFVSLYANVDVPTPVPDSETKTAVEQCLRFLTLCAEGKMAPKLDPSSDVRSLAETLQTIYDDLEQIRVYVITDRVAKSKSFKTRAWKSWTSSGCTGTGLRASHATSWWWTLLRSPALPCPVSSCPARATTTTMR
jgi:hypothetical protein